MSQSIQAFAIGNTSVRQLDGLFSLNDLHAAAGGEKRHQPSDFVRIDQTQALIAEIGNSADPRNSSSADSRSLALKIITGKGKAQGTYACRELVIAYAAWISAAFHLQVIRVFLNSISPAAIDYTRINPAQQQHLHELVDIVVASGKQTHGETWKRLHRKFHVSRYEDLPTAQFDAACQYLRGKLEGHDISSLVKKHFPTAAPALPAPTGIERMLITKNLATGETTVENLGTSSLLFKSPDHVARAVMDCRLGVEVTQKIAQHAMMGMMANAVDLKKQIRSQAVTETLNQMASLPVADLVELSSSAHMFLSGMALKTPPKPSAKGDRLLDAALSASAHA